MKKVSNDNGRIYCPTCGEITESVVRMLFSFTLDDGTSNIRVTVMGDLAEKLLNLTSEEAQNLDINKFNESMSTLLTSEDFLGKEINVIGRTKKNKFNEQLEIIAQKIEEPNILNEIKNIIEESK